MIGLLGRRGGNSLPLRSLLRRRNSLFGRFLDLLARRLDFLLVPLHRFLLNFTVMALARMILCAERHDPLVISATNLTCGHWHFQKVVFLLLGNLVLQG